MSNPQIVMEKVSDDVVEHRRVQALANADRVDQAVGLFRDAHARLVGESLQLQQAGKPGLTEAQMVRMSLVTLKVNGFTQQEIMEMLAR